MSTLEPYEPPNLREIVQRVGIRHEMELDQSCSEAHAKIISLWLDWKHVAPHLGLNQANVTEIEVDSKDEFERRLKTLQKWRAKYAFKATYRKLMEAFLIIENASHAVLVCMMLKTPDEAQNRECEPSDIRVDGATTRKGSLSSTLLVQFPGERSLERFLKTKDFLWDNRKRDNRLAFVHQPNQPQVVATLDKHTSLSIEPLLPANTYNIVLLPVLLQPGTPPASSRLASAEFLRHCHDDTEKLPVPRELSPTEDDHYRVIPYGFEFAAVNTDHYVPSFTDDRTYVLLVCVGNIHKSSTVNKPLDYENKDLANFVSNAADELLKSIEMRPRSDVPFIIQEFVNPPNPFPTPP